MCVVIGCTTHLNQYLYCDWLRHVVDVQVAQCPHVVDADDGSKSVERHQKGVAAESREGEEKRNEVPVIQPANAVIGPHAVVVELEDAHVAHRCTNVDTDI